MPTMLPSPRVEEVGVGVPADPGVGLEQRDRSAARKQVGRRQPGNPAADDGDRAPAWLYLFHIRYSERRGGRPDGR